MKRVLSVLAMATLLTFGATEVNAMSVDNADAQMVTLVAQDDAQVSTFFQEEAADSGAESSGSSSQFIKRKFVEGGPGFMGIVLACLIIGLAVVIERILYLFNADINTDAFVSQIEDALNAGGYDQAKELARNTKGPVASIYYQGLERAEQGQSLDEIEKSVVAYGGVQMGLLEKNLTWIGLFIALAPMLGFMGTVIGMIQAFDTIEASGEIVPREVAGGIKVALLTTVFGLIVAIILQVFYNFIVSKIDSIVNKMEDASIKLIDMLVSKK